MTETNQNTLFPEIEAERQSLHDIQDELVELRAHVLQSKTSYLPQYALAIAAIVALGLVAMWLNTRHQATDIEKNLSIKLAEFDARSLANSAQAKQTDERTLASVARIALLEQQLADAKNQQASLQTLYNALANTREEQAVGEVEQLLLIANQQMQLAGNVRPAILALQTADSRLQPYSNTVIAQIRLAISQDIARLQSTPLLDLLGLNAQIESSIASVDLLKLVSERTQTVTASTSNATVKKHGLLAQFSAEVWADIKDMVKVERINRSEPPLLSPAQQFFLVENVKLRLLTARLSLLQRDDVSFKKDLKASIDWINRYFDTRDAATQKLLKQLQALSKNELSIATPDITHSLSLVTQYKLSLENASLETTDSAATLLQKPAFVQPNRMSEKR